MRDPRGPERRIVEVVKGEGLKQIIVLDCGHRPDLNPVYHYRVGDVCRCYACGKAEEGVQDGRGR